MTHSMPIARLFILLLAVSVSVQAMPGVGAHAMLGGTRPARVMERQEEAASVAPGILAVLRREESARRAVSLARLLALAVIAVRSGFAYAARCPGRATPQAMRVRMND